MISLKATLTKPWESGWATCEATRRLLTSQYQMIIYHIDIACQGKN